MVFLCVLQGTLWFFYGVCVGVFARRVIDGWVCG